MHHLKEEILKNLSSIFRKARCYCRSLKAQVAVISFLVPQQKYNLLTLSKEQQLVKKTE